MHVERVDRAGAALRHLRVAGRRDLVDAVRAVDDPGAPGAEHHQRPREQFGELRPRHAHELPRRARGIGQRPEQIEGSANAQIAAHLRRMLHRWMKRAREEERDTGLAQRALDRRRRRRHVDAERLEDVRRSTLARDRSVPMLRHRHAARRNHNRRGRRDIEGARAIAAGAARIEHVVDRRAQLHRVLAHRACEADDFRRPLAFHDESGQQRAQRGRVRPPFHDFAHRRGRLVFGEVLVAHDLFEQPGEHQSSRKFRRMRRPSSVRTDSGWNCTPCTGYVV